MPIEVSDLTDVVVDGLPLGVFLVKTRLDMLTNFLLPEGCKDREEFEKDFTTFMSAVMQSVDTQKMKHQLMTPETSGLVVPGQ